MARELANIRLDIWTSQDFRDLSALEQRLYFLLLTHDSLSYAGVADWRPKRLAQFASDTTADQIESAGQSLQSKRFVLLDEDAEEVLIRSFFKHDGLLKQPRLSVSMVNAYGATTSKDIRAVIIHELLKLDASGKDLVGLRNDRVRNMLGEPSAPIESFISPGDCPPASPPISPTFGPNLTQAQGLRTSTSTTTSTLSNESVPPPASKPSKKKPETEFPEGWKPNTAHQAKAQSKGVDIEQQAETFESFHKSKGNTYRDWDQAFHTWLNRAIPAPKSSAPSTSYIWD